MTSGLVLPGWKSISVSVAYLLISIVLVVSGGGGNLDESTQPHHYGNRMVFRTPRTFRLVDIDAKNLRIFLSFQENGEHHPHHDHNIVVVYPFVNWQDPEEQQQQEDNTNNNNNKTKDDDNILIIDIVVLISKDNGSDELNGTMQ